MEKRHKIEKHDEFYIVAIRLRLKNIENKLLQGCYKHVQSVTEFCTRKYSCKKNHANIIEICLRLENIENKLLYSYYKQVQPVTQFLLENTFVRKIMHILKKHKI